MNRCLLVAALCVVLGCVIVHAKKGRPLSEKKSCNFGTCIKIVGRSGAIVVSNGKKVKSDADSLVIKFDDIKEIAEDGSQVGKSGGRDGKHSFNNFAQLQFYFSDQYNTTVQGLQAAAFNFSAVIPGPSAELVIPIYIFKQNGTIQLCDEEEIKIYAGMMKFNIDIRNWTFCGDGADCGKGKDKKTEKGKFVDFTITVKSPKGKKPKKGKKKKSKAKGRKGKNEKKVKFYFESMAMEFPEVVGID